MTVDVERYLQRIGVDEPVGNDLAALETLQRAHLSTVPFENLHVYCRLGVRTDIGWSVPKIVDEGRGGWCFEANGAFAALLDALGFEVSRLGAAVLLDGSNQIVDHLTLEVMLDRPYLVDVGFGESFVRPLALNRDDAQDGGTGSFQFLPSPQGTTLVRLVDDAPVPQYRFSRVTRQMADFEPASDRLQSDPELHWSRKPFATRLIDGGPDRVTLLRDRLKFHGVDEPHEVPVGEAEWDDVLDEWF